MLRPDRRFLAELIALALTASTVAVVARQDRPVLEDSAARSTRKAEQQAPSSGVPPQKSVAGLRLPSDELVPAPAGPREVPRPPARAPATTAGVPDIIRFPARTLARDGFVASGLPTAGMTDAAPGMWCGREGATRTTHAYMMPADGNLVVSLRATGDWDVFVFDAETGELLVYAAAGGSYGVETEERASVRLRRGRAVKMMACNYSSEQTVVDVLYSVTTGDGFPAKVNPVPGFTTLAPNGQAELAERVPVNVVFVGYSPSQIDRATFEALLPERYRPRVRFPAFYGKSQYLGIEYTYDYRLAFADGEYQDRFFAALRAMGREAPVTTYQADYNEQERNVAEIKDNFEISAVGVERWLTKNPPAGVDTARDTVFFVNWHGRPDFRFHVYRKTGEAITGSGIDRGQRDSGAITAWGGTPADDPEDPSDRVGRVWFYDLSAGPDAWTANWIVDTKDATGDDVEDYRLPPAWEYRNDGYRTPSALTGDLAKVTRYVAINLLFTPSPLYAPGLTAPWLPDSINIDLNAREGDSRQDSSDAFIRPHVMMQSFRSIMPFTKIEFDEQDLAGEDNEYARCYALATNGYGWAPSCYPDRPYADYSSLYLNNALNADSSLDDRDRIDYEFGVWSYFTAIDEAALNYAYADDNQRDGTQSMVHSFLGRPALLVVGGTDILIHEVGHHLGLSHPHDGWDYEEDIDYGAYSGRTAFASLGDKSNGVMSYLWLNNEFSQFDRDNLNRWMAAEYLRNANVLLARVLPFTPSGEQLRRLRAADAKAATVRELFADHDYLGSHRLAREVYSSVRQVAFSLGIKAVRTYEGLRVDEPAVSSAIPNGSRAYASVDRITGWIDGMPVMRPLYKSR